MDAGTRITTHGEGSSDEFMSDGLLCGVSSLVVMLVRGTSASEPRRDGSCQDQTEDIDATLYVLDHQPFTITIQPRYNSNIFIHTSCGCGWEASLVIFSSSLTRAIIVVIICETKCRCSDLPVVLHRSHPVPAI